MVTAWRRQSQHWRSPVDVLGRGRGLGDCHSFQVDKKQSITVYSSPRSAALCGMGTAQRREPETRPTSWILAWTRTSLCLLHSLLRNRSAEPTTARGDGRIECFNHAACLSEHIPFGPQRNSLPPFSWNTAKQVLWLVYVRFLCTMFIAAWAGWLAGWLYARTCCMSDLLWSFPQET